MIDLYKIVKETSGLTNRNSNEINRPQLVAAASALTLTLVEVRLHGSTRFTAVFLVQIEHFIKLRFVCIHVFLEQLVGVLILRQNLTKCFFNILVKFFGCNIMPYILHLNRY